MTVEKSLLQTGVDYVKHYSSATWRWYRNLGIWGKASFHRLTFNLWVVLPQMTYLANEPLETIALYLVLGHFLRRARYGPHPQG